MTDKDKVVPTSGRAGKRPWVLSKPAVTSGQSSPLPAQDDSPHEAPREKNRDRRDRSTGGRGGDWDGALRLDTTEIAAQHMQVMGSRTQQLSEGVPAIVHSPG